MINKINAFFNKYHQAIYTLLIVAGCLFLVWFALYGWNPFFKWMTTQVGTLAEWAGSVGTLAAFGAVIWQQNRQENITRAVHIEESRPRFFVSFTSKPKEKNMVLFWGENRDLDEINEMIEGRNGKNYRFISIDNISNNVVYDYSIILKYHSKDNSVVRTDYWSGSGMFPRRGVIIVPKFMGSNDDQVGNYVYDKLLIRFTTPANEVGFFTMVNKNNEQTDCSLGSSQYLFVRGRHVKRVTAINTDKMINVTDSICKKLDNEFSLLLGTTSFGVMQDNGKVR